jgi:hypothetical protein
MSNNKAELLKKSLMNFYKSKENIDKITNVIEKETDYSLRVIEWFCNNYSKKYDTVYKLNDGTIFNVYLSYKAQLDSYQKKQFDPFKRKHKGFEIFTIKYNKDSSIETTVCQLNFFRWCIQNKVLEYVEKNLKKIKEDMGKSTEKYKGTKNSKKEIISRKKRQPLSATRVCVKRYTNAVLEF